MMSEEFSAEVSGSEVEEGEVSAADADIDLEALAEEVYALLREELRLERERRGWREVW
jgi:hypothetical protein